MLCISEKIFPIFAILVLVHVKVQTGKKFVMRERVVNITELKPKKIEEGEKRGNL